VTRAVEAGLSGDLCRQRGGGPIRYLYPFARAAMPGAFHRGAGG